MTSISPAGHTLAEHLIELIDQASKDQQVVELVMHPYHHIVVKSDTKYQDKVVTLIPGGEGKKPVVSFHGVTVREDRKCLFPSVVMKNGEKKSL